MSYESEFSNKQRKTKNAEDSLLIEWQKGLSRPSETSISDRVFYKDLNFNSIKDYYKELIKYYNTMERLLQVRAKNPEEHLEIVKMRFAVFKRMEHMVDMLTFDWLESTASFSGSTEIRQQAYEAIVDEIKSAVSSCSPPTDREQLEMLMITFKHFVKWLLGESLNYSLGERVEATDPQRYGLQIAQVQAAAGPDAMNKGQQMNREVLNRGSNKKFKRVGSDSPTPSGDE